MPIEPRSRLGSYEILEPIGAGGMGEVYRARDTRLDRTVAIKVLPEHLSQDPARRERFEREARAVSSLNHPHICTLHDVGEHEGVHFLVMEHIEGETLSDRLKKGALPFDQALEYGIQIADGLDKAHRAGIVHRDLKPGNVMLTKAGIKLLDFGLAKTREESVTPTEDSEQPTQNKPLTDAGTILGTVQYMAPEQLEGKDVDARADLFALGAVLYEMLTGRKAFEGESQASLISAIMSGEPPLVSERQAMSPPALDRVIKKCLAKDPDDRWQTASDLGDELRWISDGGRSDAPPLVTSPRRSLTLVLGGLVTGALLASVAWLSRPTPDELSRVVVDIPRGQALTASASAPPVALSPDASLLAYVADYEGTQRLFIRDLDAFEAVLVPGTEGAEAPFFSPDGEWIAYFADGQLFRVSARGDAASLVICSCPRPRSATWGADGTIVFSAHLPSKLVRVDSSGGAPETLDIAGEGHQTFPQFLPDGKHLLYGVGSGDGEEATDINVLSLQSGEVRSVLHSDLGARATRFVSRHGSTTGHLVYSEGIGLSAVPFDLDELEPKGTPIAVLDGVYRGAGYPFFATSDNGGLVFRPGTDRSDVVWVDRTGRSELLPIETGQYDHPRLSPDGSRLVLHSSNLYLDAWILDVERGGRTRLSDGEPFHTVWSSDGSRLAYRKSDSIYWRAADGTGDEELLWTAGEGTPAPISWSPDDLIAFEGRTNAGIDIWLLDVRAREARPFLATRFEEASPVFSPDGKWLAYVSDETGKYEVYVQPYPGPGPRVPVSVRGVAEPTWSLDGREIFYRDGPRMFAVSVDTDRGLTTGEPRLLFEGDFQSDVNGHPHYGVAPDGRFLMLRREPAQVFRVFRNWAEELDRLAPPER